MVDSHRNPLAPPSAAVPPTEPAPRTFRPAGSSHPRWTIATLTLTLLAISTAAVRAEQLFAPARLDFSAGTGPSAAAIRDLNDDQIPDLVTANAISEDVAVLRGLGDAQFAQPAFFPAGGGPRGMVLEDLDGDALDDIVVANTSESSIAVLLGQGDGVFAPPVSYPAALYPRMIVVGHLDADATLDLAVTNSGSSSIGIYLGVGDGSFSPPQFVPTAAEPQSIAIEHLDSDAFADLAVAVAQHVALYLGNGDGTFASPTFIPLGGSTRGVAAGDVNDDLVPDLVVALDGSGEGGVRVLLGAGDGTFGPPITSEHCTGSAYTIELTDMNGDQLIDVVVGSCTEYGVITRTDLGVLLGDGNGTFLPGGFYDSGDYGGAPVAGDLNGDLRPEVVVPHNGGAGVFLGKGDGTLEAAPQLDAPFSGRAIGARDLNGDFIPDLVTAACLEPSSNVAVFLGLGDGAFAPFVPYAGTSCAGSLVIDQLDQDQILDVAVAVEFGTAIRLYPGVGDGSLASPIVLPTGSWPTEVASGDLNNDQLTDLAVSHRSEAGLGVLLGSPFGGFADIALQGLSDDAWTLAIDAFNGDGNLDVVVGLQGGDLDVFLGLGDGTFGTPTVVSAQGEFPTSVATGDLSGDAIVDLAVTYTNPPSLAVFLGVGDGAFAPAATYVLGEYPQHAVIADFNADQIADVATANEFPDNVSVLLGMGDGSFAPPVHYGAGQRGPYHLAFADFDLDGALDLAAPNISPQVTLLFGTVPATTSVIDETPSTRSGQVVRPSYPNPFNPYTTLSFRIDAAGETTIDFFDVCGRLVRRLTPGRLEAGEHEVVWDGRNQAGERLGSGEYFYRISVDGHFVGTAKASMVR